MYKGFDSPGRDYSAEWLEAEIELAIAGYCSSSKKNMDDSLRVSDEPPQPKSGKKPDTLF